MKKIMCLLLLVAMLMTVGVGAEDITADDTNDVSVEDVVDDAPAEVSDSEPEDTPDEAPVDVAEEPPEVEENEPEDTPDASPDDDDEIAVPVVLADANKSGFAGPWWGRKCGNVYYEYNSDTKVLRFYIGDSKGNSDYDYTIGRYYASEWEGLDVSKIIIEDGITTVNTGAFNNLSGDIVFDLPKSITTIEWGAFGTIINSLTGEDTLHGIVSYHGTGEEWNEINIKGNNAGISLSSTWYFNMYIPDTIELSNTHTSETFTTFEASDTCNIIKAGVCWGELSDNNPYETYASITASSKESNLITGVGNNVFFFAEHQCFTNEDNTQYGTCTVGIQQDKSGTYLYEEDYQDYSVSQTLTFVFNIE